MRKRIVFAFALLAAVAVSVPIPVSAADDTPSKADNTKMNKMEKGRSTADQQSESATDKKMTQQIRKAITKDKSLSTYAHNVKIITRNGMVSLKGPVKTEHEKQAVEQAALQVAGKDHVKNELVVEPSSK